MLLLQGCATAPSTRGALHLWRKRRVIYQILFLTRTWLKCTLAESSKARLRKIHEKRLSWPIHSRSLVRSSDVEERGSWAINILSAPSRASLELSHSSERGPIDLEEYEAALDLPADLKMLSGDELPSDVDDPSYLLPPLETPFVNEGTLKAPTVKTLDHPASKSMDIGLRLLQQAINERTGRFWNTETSHMSCETLFSVNLSLGQAPSFLDDICERFLFLSLPPGTEFYQLIFLFTIPCDPRR
jgi:hypothetical protein